MSLNLKAPEFLSNHLQIPPDNSAWTGIGYNLTPRNNTPARARATFKTWQKALVPYSRFGYDLASTYGIYILAFDVPYCHLYVGIAAFGDGTPEGILSRVKKHRVKATGSHVGATPSTCGGVDHTTGWRTFAKLRAQHFLAAGRTDILSDARLIVGQIYNPPSKPLNDHQNKAALEASESAICKNANNLAELRKRIWPGGCSHFSLITGRTNSRPDAGKTIIKFWEENSEKT